MTFTNWVVMGLILTAAGSPPKPIEHHAREPQPCEPGYQWIEEDSFTEVESYVCKLVPTVKKVRKIVYCTKDDPFCVMKCSLKCLCGAKSGCDDADCGKACPKCKGPYPRKILIKTEIICEEPTTRCVTEKVVNKVPCKVKRKVPCEPNMGAPAICVPPVQHGTLPPQPSGRP